MMPVKKDPSGRRSVQAEVEVPGTPEDVWKAIATGPGISSWFVPSEVEEQVGGKAVAHFGPGTSMDSIATITEWEPPHRVAMNSRDGGDDTPVVATEWIVEARSGGTCVVRVVHSWFASTDDWDNQFEGHEQGWLAFFRILRLYLTHFRGQTCSPFQVMAFTEGPTSRAWATLSEPLGLANVVDGQRVQTPAGAPSLAGVVERVGPSEYPELLLRLDRPAPGLAHLFAMPMGGQVCVPLRVYLYGPDGAAAAGPQETAWQSWIQERFSSPASKLDAPEVV